MTTPNPLKGNVFTVTEVVVTYDEPLVIRAVDSLGKPYVGLNFSDTEKAYRFAFAQVEAFMWQDYLQQRVDLRYLFTDGMKGSYRGGVLHGEVGEKFVTHLLNDEPVKFLPKVGFFHVSEENTPATTLKRQLLSTKIDGRWEIEDLRQFGTLAGDAYVFTFALTATSNAKQTKHIHELFAKYPWRGGFSTINFISDLHVMIPANDDVAIRRMKYASPGFIETLVNTDIAMTVRKIVEQINDATKGPPVRETFNAVSNNLKKNKWSGKASADIKLTAGDKDTLKGYLSELCAAINFQGKEAYIIGLGSDDRLAAVKILLAYYRRMFWIAEYLRTGKVQQLFSFVPD
ncbi:MAG TPA: hypothetical protein VE999_13240 [Gemmataceae bacterium]|jgi:hypothetical protein|nr:hypothetical protein [Gemmataceae bacterium]